MSSPLPGLCVRPARHSDATAFDAILAPTSAPSVMLSALASPGSRSFLAIGTDGLPVGFIEARRAGDDIEIIMIATRVPFRRCGVATRLLQALIAAAADEEAGRVILDVAEDNRAARELYRRNGFTEIARRPGYYRSGREGQPCDALLLAHEFASAVSHT